MNVSFVIPAHRAEKHINQCLSSLLSAPELQDFEVLVVDDASPDATSAIVEKMASHDPRIRLIKSPINVGVHSARAIGVAEALGDFIGFVDADDWVAPGFAGKLHKRAVTARADIVICGASLVDAEGTHLGAKVRFLDDAVFKDEVFERFCRFEFGSGVLWNKLFRREVIQNASQVQLQRNVDAAEDYIVNVGAFLEANTVAVDSCSLYYYRQTVDSACARSSEKQAYSRLLRAYASCLRLFGGRGANVRRAISGLYSVQAGFACYASEARAAPHGYAEEIQATLAEIVKLDPWFLCDWRPLSPTTSEPRDFSPTVLQTLRMKAALGTRLKRVIGDNRNGSIDG